MSRIGMLLVFIAATCAAQAQAVETRVPAMGGIVAGGVDRGGMPLNGENECEDATFIAGYDTWAFNLQFATTDGYTSSLCFSANSSQVWRDRWWRWTAPASGDVTIALCGQASLNHRMAVYFPTPECPPAGEYIIACSDDACGVQPSITFAAREGQDYLIRIGLTGFLEPAASGAGTFTISGPPGPEFCAQTPGPCQPIDISIDAFQSNQFIRTADDFVLGFDSPIVGVCWYGSYFQFDPPKDGFEVTYWTDAGGRPGTPIARFTQQSGLQLRRIGTNDSDYQDKRIFRYAASHPPLSLQPGTTYWLEIRNFVDGVAWRWQGSDKFGNGAIQDGVPAGTSGWGNLFVDDVAWCIRQQVDCPFDTNGDGVIDFGDLNNIVTAFNTSCP